MTKPLVFVDRRKGGDRREDCDPCRDLPVDLYHRKRRKSSERRDSTRSLSEDYYAYMEASFQAVSKQSGGDFLSN